MLLSGIAKIIAQGETKLKLKNFRLFIRIAV